MVESIIRIFKVYEYERKYCKNIESIAESIFVHSGARYYPVLVPNGYFSLKATFHLTISMRRQRARSKIQTNNYHHGSCGSFLTGKTMSVFLIFRQGTHRNVKNR